MRKIFFILLLIAGWAIIFFPLLPGNASFPGIFSDQAHPSALPLPQPWQGQPKIELNGAPANTSQEAGGLPLTGSACGNTYVIQNGDSLGEVARTCGIQLAELLKANPRIENPNHVFSGQTIYVPDPLAGRGSGDSLAFSASPNQSGRFQPGSQFTIDTGGLPPETPVRVGLGLTVSGYSVLNEAKTDANGRLSLTLRIPAGAQPGETGFVLVTTKGAPSVQRISQTFTIGE